MYAELRSTIVEEVRQRELLESKLAGRISTIGAQFDRMEELAGRVSTLGGTVVQPPEGIADLRSEVANTTSAMLDQLQMLEANVQALEASAQEAMEHIRQAKLESPENSSWDWDLLHQEEFRDLKQRVEELEDGSPTAPFSKDLESLAERIADLEGERPDGYVGGVPRTRRGEKQPSLMDAKPITGLSPLTDDKSAFRQWDLKLVNALNYTRKGYGRAVDRLKECIDRGLDLEDARPGAASYFDAAHFGTTLAHSARGEGPIEDQIDVHQLDVDLEYILIDKAKVGSNILHKITNLKKHGGIRMYAEVYKWFTETSGLGLMEQAGLLMNPKPAAKEEEIAEAIEMWEEKVNRLARHGDEYRLSETFKKVALKQMLTGKIRDNFELWEAEQMSFEDLLKKVKQQARAKKLDRDAHRGKNRVASKAGANGGNGWNDRWTEERSSPTADQSEESLNANQAGKKGKGKGKGQYGGKAARDWGRTEAAELPADPLPRQDASYVRDSIGRPSVPRMR